MTKILKIALFIVIFLLALFFRSTGINWDGNQHLHPDERFLTMVAGALTWPTTVNQYFDTANNPLNPHVKGFDFFVYGTWPVVFVKFISGLLGKDDYNNLTIMGRTLSVLMDMTTLVLIYGITIKTRKRNDAVNISLLAMFFYAVMPLPIQLSHFFTVDPFANVAMIASLYLSIIATTPITALLLGITIGLSLSAKISAALMLPAIGIALLFHIWKSKNKLRLIIWYGLMVLFSYLTIRIAYPTLFASPSFFSLHLNPSVVANWKTLKSFNNPSGWYPPAVQWITTAPILFPLKNMLWLGLGLPIGILSILSIFYYCFSQICTVRKYILRTTARFQFPIILLLVYTLTIFFYQGFQFAKAMRYFWPIYPTLAILAALFSSWIVQKWRYGIWSIGVIGITSLLFAFSFLSIYQIPHTRITASNWIAKNIEKGAVIATEYWDDPLPLHVNTISPSDYTNIQLPLYDPDTKDKWMRIYEQLTKTDYIILTSNRLYGSISTVPEKYPLTARYYKQLFDGSLGFTRVATFVSRPTIFFPWVNRCVSIPGFTYGSVSKTGDYCDTKDGISFIDDYADEMWTVYDHPVVILFKNSSH